MNKSTRGGKRRGAGRPADPRGAKRQITVRIHQDDLERLRDLLADYPVSDETVAGMLSGTLAAIASGRIVLGHGGEP
jgi:hypothetical protein